MYLLWFLSRSMSCRCYCWGRISLSLETNLSKDSDFSRDPILNIQLKHVKNCFITKKNFFKMAINGKLKSLLTFKLIISIDKDIRFSFIFLVYKSILLLSLRENWAREKENEKLATLNKHKRQRSDPNMS